MHLEITPHFSNYVFLPEPIESKFEKVLKDIITIKIYLDWEYIIYHRPYLF